MRSTLILTLTGLVATSQATTTKRPQLNMVWSAPKPTQVVEKEQLPLPPSAPTPAPHFKPRDVPALLRRQEEELETCGLYSNGVPYECGTTETCSSSGSNFGCCVGQSCALSTACLDSTAEACSANTQGLQTLCCNFFTDQPYCVTIISTNEANSYTDFRCGNIQYATDVQTITALDALSSESSSTEINSSETSDAPGSESESTDDSYYSTTGTDTADSSTETDKSGSNSDPHADSDSGGSNTGAIVGGVVGGIAVIGLLGLAFFFLRKKQNKPKPGVGANSDMGGPSPGYQAVAPGHPHPDMAQPYGGASSPQPYPSTPQPYQQQYSPYPNTVSPAGYPPTDPSPQTTVAHMATAQGAYYPQDQSKGVLPHQQQPQGFVAEVDGTGKQPVELA